MADEPIGILAREGNIAVLQMADRRFPGIFIQGDTFASIISLFDSMREEVVSQEIIEARDRLKELMVFYEETLEQHGVRRPY